LPYETEVLCRAVLCTAESGTRTTVRFLSPDGQKASPDVAENRVRLYPRRMEASRMSRVRRQNRPRGTYIFAVRCRDDRLHRQLSQAALDDQLTIPELLERLLTLRERWSQLTVPDHPLAMPTNYEAVTA
jgi:hypothetical protein